MNVTFQGNYYTQIGNLKSDFLAECNDNFPVLSCLDVFPGSIIVTFAGDSTTLDQLQVQLAEEGLDLPSFPLFLVGNAPICLFKNTKCKIETPVSQVFF